MDQLPALRALACAVLLAGCNSQAIEAQPRVMSSSDGDIRAPSTDENNLGQLAVETLADDLGIGPKLIVVDTFCALDWRDSSIGCPQPGQAYLQVISPGHRITLRVHSQFGGKTLKGMALAINFFSAGTNRGHDIIM